MSDADFLRPQSGRSWNVPMLFLQCIGIISVVFGHADMGGTTIPNLLNIAFPYYSWHMPFFVFISGYFNESGRKKPAAEFLKKKTVSLLLPALLVNLLHGAVSMWMKHLGVVSYGQDITLRNLFVTPFTTGYQFCIDVSLWFVFALYGIEVVSVLADKAARCKADRAILGVSLAVSLGCCAAAFYFHEATRGEFLNALLRFGFLFFFFRLGIFYRSTLETRLRKYLTLKTAAILFCAQAAVLGISGYGITINTRNMYLTTITVPNGFWCAVITPITALAFFLSLAYAAEPHVANFRLLYVLGGNTRYVLYYHQLCLIMFSFSLAMLQRLPFFPSVPGFSMDKLYTGQYYSGGNPGVAFIGCLLAICVPIAMCLGIRRIKNRWLALGAGAGIFAAVLLFFRIAEIIL